MKGMLQSIRINSNPHLSPFVAATFSFTFYTAYFPLYAMETNFSVSNFRLAFKIIMAASMLKLWSSTTRILLSLISFILLSSWLLPLLIKVSLWSSFGLATITVESICSLLSSYKIYRLIFSMDSSSRMTDNESSSFSLFNPKT